MKLPKLHLIFDFFSGLMGWGGGWGGGFEGGGISNVLNGLEWRWVLEWVWEWELELEWVEGEGRIGKGREGGRAA